MDLGLQTIVAKEFGFLITKFGFQCVKAGPTLVRYESESVFVNIYFDMNRSYEFGCELGRNDDLRGSLEVPFDIGEIIRSKKYSEKDTPSSYQVTSREYLKKYAKELANCLKNIANEFLVGSRDAFNKVADFRDKECEEYALETDLRLMRSQLNIVWQKKQYNLIVELLTPLKENLKQSEMKKLKYAMSKIRADL